VGRSAILLAAALLLAGCSDTAPADPKREEPFGPDDVRSPDDALNATTANATLNATTDTLYFHKAPDLAFTAPLNETILATQWNGPPGQFRWNHTLNGTGNISGAHFDVWLRLPRSAVHTGAANDPYCSIHWIVQVLRNGTLAYSYDAGCASVGLTGTVPPGDYRLQSGGPPLSNTMDVKAGDNLVVYAQLGMMIPNGGLHFIGGNQAKSSAATFLGLAEPTLNASART
jgi:hypothetical protein